MEGERCVGLGQVEGGVDAVEEAGAEGGRVVFAGVVNCYACGWGGAGLAELRGSIVDVVVVVVVVAVVDEGSVRGGQGVGGR